MEQLRIREEEWCIPTEQYEAWYQACVRVPGDVMIALDAIDSAEHSRMWSPTVPKELSYGNYDRESNTGNGAERGHTREASHREPELPALDAINAAQIRHFE